MHAEIDGAGEYSLTRRRRSRWPCSSLDPESFLHVFERYSLRLRHHQYYPNELEDHHAAKEQEDGAGRKRAGDRREKRGEQRGKNPVSGAAERLPRGAELIREDFRNENPDHRPLADGVGGDESEDEHRQERRVIGVRSPGAKSQGGNVAEGADRQ